MLRIAPTNKELETLIRTAYSKSAEVACIALLGSAGCGKSTITRRVALSLVAEGYPVFFSESEDLPSSVDLLTALGILSRKAILIFDNADIALRWISRIIEDVKAHPQPPIFVIASRTNRYGRQSGSIQQQIKVQEVNVPQLTRPEVDSLIEVLEKHNLLGRLRGMSLHQRRAEFEIRSQKQILVAMREATEGPGFNDIIKNEFQELNPIEAKLLYLCAAIPTAAGFKILREQLLGCSEVPPSAALDIIAKNLRDIVVPISGQTDWLRVRHATIAEYILDVVAPRSLLREAYIRLLKVLANDMGQQPNYRTRIFRLYRRIINHEGVYRRFSNNISDARAIFESIQDWFSVDPHFWLQFGSLELEYGELALANNYIAQAESLAPSDDLILTTKAHLLLRRAISLASNRGEANNLWEGGVTILKNQITIRGKWEIHPFHILGSQTLTFVNRWITDLEEKKKVLLETKKIVEEGFKIHSGSQDLQKLCTDMQRTYLQLAL